MTGGGFGGSVIALVPAGHIDAVTQRAAADFAAHGFDPPVPRVVTPADGARRDS
jgi:galactokinase